jgi:predicted Zn-dependent protease
VVDLIAVPRGPILRWSPFAAGPWSILYTGLTRDGTVLIENGRITRPVQNLRWNESPMRVLSRIEAIGQPQRVLGSESGEVSAAIVVPPLEVREFNFTSVSEAV